jgi:hypothetical protein
MVGRTPSRSSESTHAVWPARTAATYRFRRAAPMVGSARQASRIGGCSISYQAAAVQKEAQRPQRGQPLRPVTAGDRRRAHCVHLARRLGFLRRLKDGIESCRAHWVPDRCPKEGLKGRLPEQACEPLARTACLASPVAGCQPMQQAPAPAAAHVRQPGPGSRGHGWALCRGNLRRSTTQGTTERMPALSQPGCSPTRQPRVAAADGRTCTMTGMGSRRRVHPQKTPPHPPARQSLALGYLHADPHLRCRCWCKFSNLALQHG